MLKYQAQVEEKDEGDEDIQKLVEMTKEEGYKRNKGGEEEDQILWGMCRYVCLPRIV